MDAILTNNITLQPSRKPLS